MCSTPSTRKRNTDRTPLDTVRELGLDEADERRILGGNAAGLLGLPVTS